MPKQYRIKVVAIALAIASQSLFPLASQARGGATGGNPHGGGGGGGGHYHSGGGGYHYHGGGGRGYYGGGYYGGNYGATGGYLWGSGTGGGYGGGGYGYGNSAAGQYTASEDNRRRALPDSAFIQNYNWPQSPPTYNGPPDSPAYSYDVAGNRLQTDPNLNQPEELRAQQGVLPNIGGNHTLRHGGR